MAMIVLPKNILILSKYNNNISLKKNNNNCAWDKSYYIWQVLPSHNIFLAAGCVFADFGAMRMDTI